MFDEFLSKVSELRAAGGPFAVAIVVRHEPPVSGRPGDKAIIQGDGIIWGWIGGACAQPVVVREARDAIETGTPKLVRIAPSGHPEPGVVNYAMTCHGGGALDVYIEPVLPKPQILIVGRSAAARALSQLGKALGYATVIVTTGADRKSFPDADLNPEEIHQVQITNETSIVIATQGEQDEEALEAALRTGARYISFVASQTKAKKLLGYLEKKGVPADSLNRIKAPAGLHIGAASPEEIAVSILAEIILTRKSRSGGLARKTEATVFNRDFRDPVCGMTVDPEHAKYHSEYCERVFFFCCAGCQQTFDQHPEIYAGEEPGAAVFETGPR